MPSSRRSPPMVHPELAAAVVEATLQTAQAIGAKVSPNLLADHKFIRRVLLQPPKA